MKKLMEMELENFCNKKVNETVVIGIDPAPSKKSTLFNGYEFLDCNASELKNVLNVLEKSDSRVLICWDAPLTGSGYSKGLPELNYDGSNFEKHFSDRWIEKCLRAFVKGADKRKVSGVSVLPYSGCSHWAISRAMLGYPIVGEYDQVAERLPFKKPTGLPISDKNVVEVHPAVALWFWLGKDFKKYKGSSTFRKSAETNYSLLTNKLNIEKRTDINNSDDKLDAFVAYILGRLWLENKEEVKMYGDEQLGSMLLPKSDRFESELEKMNKNEKGNKHN